MWFSSVERSILPFFGLFSHLQFCIGALWWDCFICVECIWLLYGEHPKPALRTCGCRNKMSASLSATIVTDRGTFLLQLWDLSVESSWPLAWALKPWTCVEKPVCLPWPRSSPVWVVMTVGSPWAGWGWVSRVPRARCTWVALHWACYHNAHKC